MVIIIPTRLRSSRIVCKPLQLIGGKPLIQHVYEKCVEAARQSDTITNVYIAVDDQPSLIKAVAGFTNDYAVTREKLNNGTERCYQAGLKLNLPLSTKIINVQGDVFDVSTDAILQIEKQLNSCLGYQKNSTTYTLYEQLTECERINEATVKVVNGDNNKALFFTRQNYPTAFKHCGIYGYHMAFLKRYCEFGVGKLETFENLEQMRTLEHGLDIHCSELQSDRPFGFTIDTFDDINRVVKLTEEQRKHGD